METLLKQFDSFIKRSMLPSSLLVLILLLFSYDKLFYYLDRLSPYLNQDYTFILIFLFFIFLIAISLVMSIITQLVFDNTLKENFESFFIYKNENRLLKQLREKSIEKLQQETDAFNDIELTDYTLYQILGRKLQFFKKPTSTKRYIDEIKASESIFFALIISIFVHLLLNLSVINLLVSSFGIIATIGITYEYIKSKYRSRSIRIYTNFLIGEE